MEVLTGVFRDRGALTMTRRPFFSWHVSNSRCEVGMTRDVPSAKPGPDWRPALPPGVAEAAGAVVVAAYAGWRRQNHRRLVAPTHRAAHILLVLATS